MVGELDFYVMCRTYMHNDDMYNALAVLYCVEAVFYNCKYGWNDCFIDWENKIYERPNTNTGS